ncbi:polymorphic toxin type 50 domain-containing protein, partial [Bacillus licheniformis]|uniref:polymorphic toxin type 50 domain-containing protein n=1 Tax=Bacillus licheniformis TaxID=1402 RepID=UPI002DB8716F
ETMQRYMARLEKMYTGPKIEITSYQKGAILKPDEMDNLSGNQETAMGAMLKKVGDKEDADINTLADPDRLKKLATQKVSKKEYTQEELNELKKDYRVFNDTLYRAYIDGDTIVKIEPAYTLPENVEKSDFAKYFDTAMEFTGVYDAVRAAFGYDLATGEIVKDNGDRLMAGLSVTPFGKAFKYGKRGFKLFKGEEAGKKLAKVDKTPSYGKQSVPKGPYREVHGFPAKVKPGAQEKHIPGTPNYKQEIANGRKNKSIFYGGDNKTAQELLDKFAGKGTLLKNGVKERVDFGKVIGKFYDKDTGKYVETTRGLIHYSKNGAHIVPSEPLKP